MDTSKLKQQLLEEFDKYWLYDLQLPAKAGAKELNGAKNFLNHTIDRVRKEERERIIAGLEKEYEGQISQVQDAIDYISSLTPKDN